MRLEALLVEMYGLVVTYHGGNILDCGRKSRTLMGIFLGHSIEIMHIAKTSFF